MKGVNVLYHESTYGNDNRQLAGTYMHSTAEQAAMVARDAGAGELLLGHYSQRYDDESILLKEACDVFPNTRLTCERMTIEVK